MLVTIRHLADHGVDEIERIRVEDSTAPEKFGHKNLYNGLADMLINRWASVNQIGDAGVYTSKILRK